MCKKDKTALTAISHNNGRGIVTAAFLFYTAGFLFSFLSYYSGSAEAAIITPGTCMVPEGKFDTVTSVRYIADSGYTAGIDLAFSPLPRLGIGFSFTYLYPSDETMQSLPGDADFRIKYYAGDFYNDDLSLALIADFKIPSGPSAYSEPKYKYLAFGNNELNLGISASYRTTERETIQAFAGYLFRGAERENIYSGIYLNPAHADTYKSLLGMNPFFKGAFLHPDKLRNDCAAVSLAVNTMRFYPINPVFEIYHLRRILTEKNSSQAGGFAGSGINPVLAAVEIRWLINENFFAGIYSSAEITSADGYPPYSAGLKIQYYL